MVRDDRDDVHVDLADAACIEQMAKAVVELGDERDHLAALRSRPKRPVHLETRRDVDERRLETLRVVVKKPCHHPHEEGVGRSEEHTSELQSLMRISYAVFCLKQKNPTTTPTNSISSTHTSENKTQRQNTNIHFTLKHKNKTKKHHIINR